MKANPPTLTGTVISIAVRIAKGPRRVRQIVGYSAMSIAKTLIDQVFPKIAEDMHSWTDAMLQERRAQAQSAVADARKEVAEAIQAANAASLPKRTDALARAETAQKRAQAAKTQAEADAIQMDAETRRLAAI